MGKGQPGADARLTHAAADHKPTQGQKPAASPSKSVHYRLPGNYKGKEYSRSRRESAGEWRGVVLKIFHGKAAFCAWAISPQSTTISPTMESIGIGGIRHHQVTPSKGNRKQPAAPFLPVILKRSLIQCSWCEAGQPLLTINSVMMRIGSVGFIPAERLHRKLMPSLDHHILFHENIIPSPTPGDLYFLSLNQQWNRRANPADNQCVPALSSACSINHGSRRLRNAARRCALRNI